MKNRYELILFDFDGTLVDTIEDIAFYVNSVLLDEGFGPKPVSAVEAALGMGVHELLRGLVPELGLDESRLENAVNIFKKRYRTKPVLKTKPYEGVVSMLTGPLAKIKKAIVTNKPQDITEQILKQLELDQYFKMTIGMHAGFLPKPDPTATLHVIQTLEALPKTTVFIGDSHIDAAVAQNAGIDFGWVSYGYDKPKHIKPVFSFAAASEWRLLAS